MGPTVVGGNTPTPIPGIPALPTGGKEYTDNDVRQLVAALEEPFDPKEIKWRVTNTTSDKRRGQVIAYADPRAYTDRLNEMFSVRGWTRKYSIQTINNVERKLKDGGTQVAGKIVVTCEVSIHALGTHSGIGEEWADNENAGTAAEAQAFKRACSCFGLGRYLYNLEGGWVDLDERKQPKSTPKLPDWAIPKRKAGSRPGTGNGSNGNGSLKPQETSALRSRLNALMAQVGASLSGSVLMEIAKVAKPDEIPPISVAAVVAKLEDTLRGVERLRVAVGVVGQERYAQLCREGHFPNGDIPDRKALRDLITVLEKEAAERQQGQATTTADGKRTDGSGQPSAKEVAEARSALIKEAQRVGRLRQMKVADVVDRAAKGAFTFADLNRSTCAIAAVQVATQVLRKIES